jgi:hypothetical protein
MKRIITVLSVSIMALSPLASADNTSAQSSAFGGEGGAGGAGGTGIGNGGMGGVGFGGNAQGGTGLGGLGQGGIGQGGIGQGGAATSEGSNQSSNVHFDQIRQSPSVFMGAPMPTAPCQASMGGFLSFIGGIGMAGSRTLEECEIRESSRIAHAVGEQKMAKEILCMGKYASQTSQCKAM